MILDAQIISEERRLNRLRNEKINIDISNFFEDEIIRNQRKLNKLQSNIDIRKNGYCEICNIKVHKSSIAKHLRSIKHEENQFIIPNNFFKENQSLTTKINTQNFNPKSLKEIAIDKLNLNNRELNKEIAKKMLNPYYFKDKYFYNFLKINLDSHHINHLNSKITIITSSLEYDKSIDKDLINSLIREMSVIYARLINSFKFKYQCTFLSRFDKQDEDNQFLDETELFINLKINHNLTESDLKKINIRSDLERQIS